MKWRERKKEMFNSNILQIVAVCLRRRLSLLYMNRKPKRENKQKQIFLFRFWNMFTEQSPTLQMCVDHMCVCVVDDCSSVANNTMDIKKNFYFTENSTRSFFSFFSILSLCLLTIESRAESKMIVFFLLSNR